jgi:uncharacterized membrane protein
MFRARIFGQPLHPILVVFPLGLLATSFFFDLAWLATGRAALAVAAGWIMVSGVAGSAIASVVGVFDWMAIPRGSRAWKVGALHGGGNVVVALLFAASWLLRRDAPGHPAAIEIALSASGVLLTVVTGWLGSEVAERLEEVAGG